MSTIADRLFLEEERRQRVRDKERARSWKERAEEDPTTGRTTAADLEPLPGIRRRSIRTVAAFLDALYALREAQGREPTPGSSLGGLVTYGTTLQDDGALAAAANPRLPLEAAEFLEKLERVWADLQPEERRVLHLQHRDGLDYDQVAAVLRQEGVHRPRGAPADATYVNKLVSAAHKKILKHPVFVELGSPER